MVKEGVKNGIESSIATVVISGGLAYSMNAPTVEQQLIGLAVMLVGFGMYQLKYKK